MIQRRGKLAGLAIVTSIFLSAPLISEFLSSPSDSSNSGIIKYARAQPSDNFLSFVNSKYGIEIDYPSDWYKEEYFGNYIVAFYSPYEDNQDQYSEYVGIFTEAIQKGSLSLDGYVAAYLEELKSSFPELEITERTSSTLSGNPARILVTKDTDFDKDGNLDHKSKRVITVTNDGRVYVIIYDALQGRYETYLPIFDRMVESVNIDTSMLPPPTTGQQDLTYDNSTYGISTKYPDNWDVVGADGDILIVFFYPPYDNDFDSFEEYLVMGYEDVPPGTTLGEYSQVNTASFRQGDSYFELLESTSAILSGYPGQKIVFTSYAPGFGETKNMAIWTVYNDRAYTIFFYSHVSSFDKYLPIVEQMLKSFTITYKGPSQYQLETKEFFEYHNRNSALTISYPDNWEKSETTDIASGNVVMFTSPLQNAFVSIDIESLYFQPMTLDEYTELSLNSLKKSISLMEMQESRPTILSGEPAQKVVYTGLFTFFGDTLVNLKAIQVWTIVESRAYVVTYMSYPEDFEQYLPVVEKMVSSLQIDKHQIPKRVEKTYENLELGLSIELPDNWIGAAGITELNEEIPFDTTVIIIPELANMSSLERAGDTDPMMKELFSSLMLIAAVDTEDVLHGKFSEYAEKNKGHCDRSHSAEIVQLSGLKAMKMETICRSPDDEYHTTLYIVLTAEDTIALIFYGSGDYQEKQSKFDSALETLIVTNAIDLSDPVALASVIGGEKRQLTMHTVLVDENPYELPILSNSTITGLTLEPEKKQISLKVEGEQGT